LPHFLAELVFPLLKLRHSQFPPLTDNYPSQEWLFLWYTYGTDSCWVERKTDIERSCGSMYPLYCIRAPPCGHSTKLVTVLNITNVLNVATWRKTFPISTKTHKYFPLLHLKIALYSNVTRPCFFTHTLLYFSMLYRAKAVLTVLGMKKLNIFWGHLSWCTSLQYLGLGQKCRLQ
jgi:hypothetical protein